MVIESKDEVYAWFKGLSGANRIEVLSRLLHISIPLEWRFFANLVECLSRKDYLSLLEDEREANNATILESLCSTDWLADVVPPQAPIITNTSNAVIPQTLSQPTTPQPPIPPTQLVSMKNGLTSPSSPQPTGTTTITPGNVDATTMAVVVDNTTTAVTNPMQQLPPTPVQAVPVVCPLPSIRSKVVVSLCLLFSTNRVCATVMFKAISRQFSKENLRSHLEPSTAGKKKVVSPPIAPFPDHQLVAEINLIFTLALYHPAFSFEQLSNLNYQFQDVCEYLESLSSPYSNAALRINNNNVHYNYYYNNSDNNYHPVTSPTTTRVPVVSATPPHPHHGAVQPATLHPAPPSGPPLAMPYKEYFLNNTGDASNGTTTNTTDNNRSRIICCYNCGEIGHRGNECPKLTLDDLMFDRTNPTATYPLT